MLGTYRQCVIALFIGLASVQGTVAQTCPYDHPNCICMSPEVTCSNLQQIPPLKTGAGVAHVSMLTFKGGNITRIASNLLPPGLEKITLSSLPLTDISNDAFDNCAATLIYLQITGAKFTTLPRALLKLRNLAELRLVDTPVQVWDDATLQQLGKSVATLEMRNVSLPTWPSWLSYFKSLISLTLDANSLTNVPDDAFNSVNGSLRELRMKNTNLTQLPHALSMVSSLQILDLGSNRFKDSEIQSLTLMPFATELLSLYLNSVGLTEFVTLSDMTNLTALNVTNSSISDVPQGSVFQFLSILTLSGNNLTSVPADIVDLLHLSYINLAHNQITDIEPDTFPSSIEEIDLSFNYLTAINNTDFLKLGGLHSLALNYNPISTIAPGAFSDLGSLTYLNLMGSRLVEVPVAFASLTNAVNIEMSTVEAVSCPCPAARELVEWYTSNVIKTITCISCKGEQNVCHYLNYYCGIQMTARREQTSTISAPSPSSSSTSLPLMSSTSPNSSPFSIHFSASYYYLIIISIIVFIHHHHQTVPSPH